ncbi:uncharacterized protein LOC134233780 isoform X2 [Saccostrea cucullata]|uniref:uncharacterized protein LOC134233780 isoform X2 n=1 Tax=Saccostrea cuccullata TaxID=36930 RepID=UPI002ED334F6
MFIMGDIYTVSFIWMLVFEFADISGGENICPRENITQCCAGYRTINGTCTVCVGFYGQNCAHPCPDDHYGEKCELRCNCSLGESCNPYVGCLSGETGLSSETGKRSATDKAYGNKTIDKTVSHQSVPNCVTQTVIVFVLSGSNLLLLALCIGMTCCWRRSKKSKFLNSVTTNNLYAGEKDICSSGHNSQSEHRNTVYNTYSHIRFKNEELIIHNPDGYSTTVLPYDTVQDVKIESTYNGFSEGRVVHEQPVGVMDTFRPAVDKKISPEISHPTTRPYSLANLNRDAAES